MTQYLINGTTLTNIGDAIRTQLGTSTLYDPVDMPTAISNISGGIPAEELVSEFDFENDNTYTDIARNMPLGTAHHGNISIVEDEGLVNTQGGGWCRTLFAFNPTIPYRIEIEFGEFDADASLTSGNKAIINYGRNGNTDNFFGYNFGTSKFTFKTGSGTISTTDTYSANYLSNKSLTIYHSCNFVNNTLTDMNDSNFYFYVDDEYLGLGNQTSIGDIAQLGFFRSSDGFYNATIKNCKIYKLNNLPVYSG